MIPLGVLGSARVEAASGGPLNHAYITNRVDSGSGATYTWTGVEIGNPSPTRTVVVVFTARISSSQTTATTITATIGGVAATIDHYKHILPHEQGGNPTGAVGFIRLAVPTGTTATIAVAVSAACLLAGISVYTFDAPAAPQDFAWSYSAGAGGSDTTMSTVAGGALITAASFNSSANANLVYPTADYSKLVVGSTYYQQAGSAATTGANSTAIWTTSSPAYAVIAAATYGPA